ncbi:MAG: diflavin oxidoreductase [Vicinamibacterales bacterium]
MTGVSTMAYTQRNPFHARRTSSYRITPQGAPKDTQHHIVSLAESAMTYRPGDSLGICPRNPEPLVDAILARLGATGDERVTVGQGIEMTFREALATKADLAIPSKRLLEACVAQGAENLRPLVEKGGEERFKHYVHAWDDAHDVLDVLADAAGCQFTPQEFTTLMRALQPRLYSISSSLLRHPEEAHLLVLSVAYPIRGRDRFGVCSTYINDRWLEGTTAPVYLQEAQKHFPLPADPATPMIMIGPGTGLAPFRAFLEEREELGATGRNWLFFGEQAAQWGFYYGEELTAWQRGGFLRLDLAFSRDQPHKIYVQHRMHEQARDLYGWLEEGAELFICGDKGKMAADVQKELLAILESHGGRTPDQAAEYLAALKKSHRLKLDVY